MSDFEILSITFMVMSIVISVLIDGLNKTKQKSNR